MSLLHLLAQALVRGPSTVAAPAPDAEALAQLAARLGERAQAKLGRSLAIRAIDAGSCNGCELEIHAANGPVYDLERFGIRFVASPRHADVLLITGPVTANMAEAVMRTFDAAPSPKWVVAMGDCAVDGGCFKGSPAVLNGVQALLPVDLTIPGCPPSPEKLVAGLLALLQVVAEGS
jgi:Ni,Fe-hydrogenase III small subunit